MAAEGGRMAVVREVASSHTSSESIDCDISDL